MTKEDISRIIKESRMMAGLTQAQVAERLERPQATVAGWEVGRSQPDANTLFELFQVLGRSVDEAFGFQKNTPPLSGRAIKLAQAFDKLDEAGKTILEDSLEREENRMDEIQESLQAFINSFTVLQIYKTPISDNSGLDLAERPEPKMIQITKNTPEDQASTIRQVMRANNPFGVRFRFDDGKEIIFAIDGDKVAEPGQAGIFTIDGKSFLKRLENDGLYPVQKEHDPIPVPDVLQRTGRVIGWFGTDLVGDIHGTNLQF